MKNEINDVDLLDALESNQLVSVVFHTKRNTKRDMRCSRMLSAIPEDQREGIFDPKLNGPEIVAVYDFQNSGWRAFRLDSVISFEVIEK